MRHDRRRWRVVGLKLREQLLSVVCHLAVRIFFRQQHEFFARPVVRAHFLIAEGQVIEGGRGHRFIGILLHDLVKPMRRGKK